MSKTNLLSLFIFVIIVVVAAELLVNDYTDEAEVQKKIGSVQNGDLAAAVLGSGDPDLNGQTSLINFDTEGLAPKATADLAQSTDNTATVTQPDAPSNEQSSFEQPSLLQTSSMPMSDQLLDDAQKTMIGFGLVQQVGFQNVVIQRVPFNGIMFERVDMRDFKSVSILQQNLLQNNRDKVAEMYEIHAESQLLANEIYLLVKEKAAGAIEAGINETNEYGNGSFYINYSDRANTAFLVVKVRESVYAFVYKKELHPYIKSLILLL